MIRVYRAVSTATISGRPRISFLCLANVIARSMRLISSSGGGCWVSCIYLCVNSLVWKRAGTRPAST